MRCDAMRSGLNYYSHYLVKAQLNLKQPFVLTHNTRDGGVMTDMPYPIYAEGLYRAIQRCARLKLPIYITENGLADAADDRRALFIRRYLYAVSKAIADGYDVRGYFWWSLMEYVLCHHFLPPSFNLTPLPV